MTKSALILLQPELQICFNLTAIRQGSKIALVRSYLRVPQAAGQVKILIFLVKIIFFPMYANIFSDAGQVPILRYFEACQSDKNCFNPLATRVANLL